MPRPVVTYSLLITCGLVFLAMEASGGSKSFPVLFRFGALMHEEIAAGQWWRLVTPIFLHIGAMHLAFNGFALYQLGPVCEYLFGRPRFLAIFLLAGLGGTLCSYTFGHAMSAGASGAIFGLAGLLVTMALTKHAHLHPQARRSLLVGIGPMIGFNLIYGFTMEGIDNYGHLGGLLIGGMLGILVRPGHGRPFMNALCVLLGSVVLTLSAWSQWDASRGLPSSRALEADMSFFLTFHEQVRNHVYQYEAARAQAARTNDMAAYRNVAHDVMLALQSLRDEVAKHFASESVQDEREAVQTIMAVLIAGMERVQSTSPEEHNDGMRTIRKGMTLFAQWTERVVAWGRDQGLPLQLLPAGTGR